jgi:hypothetical protein
MNHADGVTPQRFENLLVMMWGEEKPQFVTVSIGGDIENTEDFEYDGMTFYYFRDDAELMSSFRPNWEGSTGDFYTVAILGEDAESGDYKPFSVTATRITNYGATVWARNQEEAEQYLDTWIVDDFSEVGQEFTIDEVYEA